jgi:LysM repeat protein
MMNTIKTIVVVATLIGVGYGAHIVLNKPIPNAQFGAGESGFADVPGFEKPTLQLPPTESGEASVSLPPLNGSPTASAQGFGDSSDVQLPPAGASTNSAAAVSTPPVPQNLAAATAASALPPLRETPQTSLPATTNVVNAVENLSNTSQAAGGTANAFPSAQQATATANVAAANIASAATAALGQAQSAIGGAAHLVTQAAGAQPATALAVPASGLQETYGSPALSGQVAAAGAVMGERFGELWESAQSKIENGQLVDSLLSLSMSYNDSTLTSAQRDQLIPLLDQLAGSVIYSAQPHVEAPYVVQSGDTIESIAASYGLTPTFLMRTNSLASPIVQPGQQLKVIRGPFRGELSLARREVTLFANRYYAGRFPVAVGRDLPPQVSMLEVVEVAGPRPYTDPRTGEQVAASDPHNPYGNYWIGLRDAANPTITNLGIHATGAMVDASDSRGCISVSAEDADDLKAILTIGSRIQVVP